MTESGTLWTSGTPLALRELESLLGAGYSVSRSRPVRASFQCLDAHGYPLYFAGLALILENNNVALCRLADIGGDAQLASTALPEKGAPPRFWWDLPQSELRILLQPHLKLRALQAVVSLHRHCQGLVLKNGDGKTVVRLQLENFSDGAKRQPFYRQLRVMPLRGYDAERDALIRLLDERLNLEAAAASPLAAWFEHRGTPPAPYSSKIKRKLKPEHSARSAMCALIGDALALMADNEAGVIADIDTEFLHDYRVSLRKIRSLLNQLKGVLPEELTASLKKEFRDLGQRTNRLRDLDVYLLEKTAYFDRLPSDLQPGLDSMFADYAAERAEQQQRLARFFRSRGYRQKMQRLNTLFADPEALSPSPCADTPVIDLAKAGIRKKHRKLSRVGRAITPASPDEALHQLRIDGKKLRYLLDFFASLFPKGEIGPLLGDLKKLQDALGRYNDLAVQQQSLRTYIAQRQHSADSASPHKQDAANPLAPGASADPHPVDERALLALGALLGILHREQRQLHDELAGHFKAFDSDATRAHVAALLSDAGKGDS